MLSINNDDTFYLYWPSSLRNTQTDHQEPDYHAVIRMQINPCATWKPGDMLDVMGVTGIATRAVVRIIELTSIYDRYIVRLPNKISTSESSGHSYPTMHGLACKPF